MLQLCQNYFTLLYYGSSFFYECCFLSCSRKCRLFIVIVIFVPVMKMKALVQMVVCVVLYCLKVSILWIFWFQVEDSVYNSVCPWNWSSFAMEFFQQCRVCKFIFNWKWSNLEYFCFLQILVQFTVQMCSKFKVTLYTCWYM